ncbi:MAG TPA: nickel pincer cofactor biosynthesis protein LarC [Vicinamibacterales bacterium]|nr:nickel pincer cofactor biosynthesis protein LarC [Vicinamibacterales bacterium]
MRILYFDCFAGASGDMVLGALIDAGVPLDDIRRALGSLAITPDSVWTEQVVRAGVRATKFCVRGEDPGSAYVDEHAHAHVHAHGRHEHHAHDHHGHESAQAHSHAQPHHHVHRTLAEITTLIEGSALSPAGKARATDLFLQLGAAEAAIHGTTLEQVHLHEVGALDSIIDIVGAVYALESLGADRIVASPLNVGSGSIRSAHGVYPVPAPATLRLLQGAPIYSGPQKAEMVTPTGALLVKSYASEFGTIPAMKVSAVGYGAGSRDFPETPNVLRVLIGEADRTAPSASVVVIEADIDDMNPQIFGVVMDTLLAEGALDVFYTPIQMKKNRPGILLTVIAAPDARERLTATIFRETTTIGVRYREMARECLDREDVTVQTALGAVRVKVARRDGRVLNASPEFEDCVRIAREHNVPVKEVQALATKAFLS